jgi:hypothetical protein
MMQVNKTLTSLNLCCNQLDPEGGKALAKSLEVIFLFSMSALHDSQLDLPFFAVFCGR